MYVGDNEKFLVKIIFLLKYTKYSQVNFGFLVAEAQKESRVLHSYDLKRGTEAAHWFLKGLI